MNKKVKTKTVAATFITLFNLVAVFSACIAWFSAKRKVDQTGEGFEVVSYNGLVKTISLYPLADDADIAHKYSSIPFLSYEVDGKTGSLKKTIGNQQESIGKYDQLDSPFHSILYVFEFDCNAASLQEQIQIAAKTTTSKESSPLSPDVELKEKDNSLTAITEFSYPTEWLNEKKFDFTDTDTLTKNKFYSLKTENNKTEIDKYEQSLTIINKDAKDMTGDSFFFEILVEYDTEALEYLYNLNLGSEILDKIDENNTLKFKQDWYFEIR